MGLAVRNRKSSPKSYYSCEWSNGYSFFIGFLYRVIPADGVCLPCAFLTDGRLLRLILLFVLVRIPFEKIKLRPLVVGTDESTEQVPSLSVMPLMQVALPCASATCNSPVRSSSFSRVGNCDIIRLIVARK